MTKTGDTYQLTTGEGVRDWARFDVSEVPPQGGYIAKFCPVVAQNKVLRPVEPLPTSALLQRRFDAGNDFETAMAETVMSDVLVDRALSRAEREAETVDAMIRGAGVIFGGRLPTDEVGRRVGEPDLLIRDESPSERAAWSYRPVDIKHHLTLNAAEDGTALCSPLESPYLADAAVYPAADGRKHKRDLLQLAHYQRMLEAAGWASPTGCWGGIVGKEQRVVWWDLNEKLWRTPAVSKKFRMRTTMDVYDFEFAFRLDIMAAAALHQADPDQDLLVVPIRNSDCGECGWREHCDPQLEAGAGDISLVPRLGWLQWKVHRDTTGATRRDRLAALDWRTADLVASGVDVAGLLRDTDSCGPAEPIESLMPRQRDRDALQRHGISTVAGVAVLCPATAVYSGHAVGSLSTHIDQARAALNDRPAFRKRNVDGVVVPRADIEIDVDMENTDDGAYQWGALVTDRAGSGVVTPGYHAFVSWEPTFEAFQETFADFWRWFTEQRRLASERGLSFHAYCYNASAENGQMLKLAGPLESDVRDFIDSTDWVDLLKVVRDQLITGTGFSLKVVAPMAGFEWAADDAGGGEAMVKYDVAVGAGPEAEKAREWLLEYNRNDVEATLAVRDWLEAAGLRSITELDAVWHPDCGGHDR